MSINVLTIILSNKTIKIRKKSVLNNVWRRGVSSYPFSYQKPLPTWMILEQVQDTWSYH